MSCNYELNPACFLAAPGLAQQAALRNTKVRLDLLTDRILVVGKGIRRGICHTVHLYAKANDHDKIKYWDVNNLYGQKMPQKSRVNNFKWVKNFLNLIKAL